MSNLLIMPVLIPLCAAVLLIFLKENQRAQRLVAACASILSLAAALILISRIHRHGIQTLHMGGWAPPFGIVFVGDMLAGLLVLTTALTAAAVLLYSFFTIGPERERNYYYVFFHFLLVGVNGSFLTGDIFNLFVFFEVLLISSYALISLGGTRAQLRETVKYLLINIVSSTLFVAAVAYLYAAVGTLNMAQLSQRIAEAGQGGVLNVIALLFLIVFSLKAGLFLFFWLPESYSAPPLAVRALFGALLTKVGLYAVLRTFTLIFAYDPGFTHPWIAGMGAAAMILGGIGAIAYTDIPRILNYNVIISVGFVALGLAAATPDALDGAVFYLMHDMLSKGLMYMLGGIIIMLAGSEKLGDMGGMLRRYPLIGWMFLVLALAVAGIPPLSGFAGKVLIIRGALDQGMLTLSLIGLASSFLVLYSLIKIFMLAFWRNEPAREYPKVQTQGATAAAAGLLAIVIAMGIGSEIVYEYVAEAGAIMAHPQAYIEAVLKE
ncbi:Na(+)/H(+) antiporter subunit D [compost metagenome]